MEVVRGPRGSMYGSDAIGGVIHVITRSSPAPYARVTAGSYGTAGNSTGGWVMTAKTAGSASTPGTGTSMDFPPRTPGDSVTTRTTTVSRQPTSASRGPAQADYPGRWQYSLLALDSESEFDQGVRLRHEQCSCLGGISTAAFRQDWDYQLLGGYVSDELNTDFGYFSIGVRIPKRYRLQLAKSIDRWPGWRLWLWT